MLRKNLLPGSVVVYLKPVQYLETPRGFGLAEFHRYRLIVQTLVDPSEGDAISIQLTATSRQCCRVKRRAAPNKGCRKLSAKKTTPRRR
jgi:hypothetical protein